MGFHGVVDIPPVMLLVCDAHAPWVRREFVGRYAQDYDVQCVGTLAHLEGRIQENVEAGRPVAFVGLVLEGECGIPDGDPTAIRRFYDPAIRLVPTAKRLALVPPGAFRELVDAVRPAVADGAIDAYATLPSGLRDEEFHTAIVELLSDWAWTTSTTSVAVLRIVADPDCADAVAPIRDFADRMGIPHVVHRSDSEQGAAILARAADADVALDLPVVEVFDFTPMSRPSIGQLGEQLSAPGQELQGGTVDLAIVGAGPAGLAAAVYAASEGLSVVAIDASAIGGQAGTSSMIRNYLGFPRGISGMRLAQRARFQAARFGAIFHAGRPVRELIPAQRPGELHRLLVDDSARSELCARAVLVTSGVKYRRLGVEGIEALLGRGVNYGAAASTARDMVGKDVYVVGGGNSAGQAAIHLARFAKSVTIAVRRAGLTETMSDYLIREIESNPRITVRPRTEVVDGGGEGRLEWLTVRDSSAGAPVEERVEVGGLYLLLGAVPCTWWLPESIRRDEDGFVLTGPKLPMDTWVRGEDGEPRAPGTFETSVPGVFAAGDVRRGSTKRVAAATGEGAGVIPLVHAYLAETNG